MMRRLSWLRGVVGQRKMWRLAQRIAEGAWAGRRPARRNPVLRQRLFVGDLVISAKVLVDWLLRGLEPSLTYEEMLQRGNLLQHWPRLSAEGKLKIWQTLPDREKKRIWEQLPAEDKEWFWAKLPAYDKLLFWSFAGVEERLAAWESLSDQEKVRIWRRLPMEEKERLWQKMPGSDRWLLWWNLPTVEQRRLAPYMPREELDELRQMEWEEKLEKKKLGPEDFPYVNCVACGNVEKVNYFDSMYLMRHAPEELLQALDVRRENLPGYVCRDCLQKVDLPRCVDCGVRSIDIDDYYYGLDSDRVTGDEDNRGDMLCRWCKNNRMKNYNMMYYHLQKNPVLRARYSEILDWLTDREMQLVERARLESVPPEALRDSFLTLEDLNELKKIDWDARLRLAVRKKVAERYTIYNYLSRLLEEIYGVSNPWSFRKVRGVCPSCDIMFWHDIMRLPGEAIIETHEGEVDDPLYIEKIAVNNVIRNLRKKLEALMARQDISVDIDSGNNPKYGIDDEYGGAFSFLCRKCREKTMKQKQQKKLQRQQQQPAAPAAGALSGPGQPVETLESLELPLPADLPETPTPESPPTE